MPNKLLDKAAGGVPFDQRGDKNSGSGAVYSPNALQAITGWFARPANTTPYSQYDLVANDATTAAPITFANAVRTISDCVRVEGARIRSTNPAAKGIQFRLHLFRTLPVLTGVADNGVLNTGGADALAVADLAGYVDSVDITLDRSGGVGACGRATFGPRTMTAHADKALYGLLEMRSASYTPASGEEIHVVLEGVWP